MTAIVPGSFRDRNGRVVRHENRIFRTLSDTAYQTISEMTKTGTLEMLMSENNLWPATLKNADEVPKEIVDLSPSGRVLEHPEISFISHPYEWSFSQLKSAAITHLNLHLSALKLGYNLADGSAYNIQFIGTKAYFIDTLSLIEYNDGDYWDGYRQFVEQFLCPLLLRCKLGTPFNSWFRGELEGIPVGEFAKLARMRDFFSPVMLFHVILHAHLQSKHSDARENAKKTNLSFSKTKLRNLLLSLKNTIMALKLPAGGSSEWGDYEHDNSYTNEETQKKKDLIANFITRTESKTVWDLGCNSGLFSEAALQGGATQAIGFDIDHNALEAAFNRAKSKKINLLPLYFNAMNPSPNQGWMQSERLGFSDRKNADSILALAFIHHLVVGRNALLTDVVNWLISLAPNGVIEFVPKSDPMIQRMLATREDIFNDYTKENFIIAIERNAKIENREVVSQSGRELFFYRKK